MKNINVILSELKQKIGRPLSESTSYVPAGDEKKAKKEVKNARDFLTPHDANADQPISSKEVMKTPQLDPEDEKKDRAKSLKDVEAKIKNIVALAKKDNKTPEEFVPNLWIDLMRERARYS